MSGSVRRTTWGVALLALLAAMTLSTKFVSGSSAATGQAESFDPAKFAAERLPELTREISAKAVSITQLAPAVDKSLTAAGKQYGQDLGAGSFAFPVKASGVVTEVDENFAVVSVTGLPEGDTVRIPMAAAVNGAPVRDATGTIRYGDFPDQTAYQNVATALGTLLLEKVIKPATLRSKKGERVEVVGAYASGGPRRSFIIQPVTITAAAR